MTEPQKDWPVMELRRVVGDSFPDPQEKHKDYWPRETERYIPESRLLSDGLVGAALESLFPNDSNARASWSPQITQAIEAAIKAISEQ